MLRGNSNFLVFPIIASISTSFLTISKGGFSTCTENSNGVISSESDTWHLTFNIYPISLVLIDLKVNLFMLKVAK